MTVGIIAEDDSDVAVLKEITLKILRPHRVGFKKFVGDGCGKVRRKCGAWAANLVQQGCRWIAVVHDLDDHDETELRVHLAAAIGRAGAERDVVLIPRREIEAWLLYDADAIAVAFREAKRPRLPANPECLADPKKHLRNLVWATYRKDYANTVHNPRIARNIDLDLLQGSQSFAPYPIFSGAVKCALAAVGARPQGRGALVRGARRPW